MATYLAPTGHAIGIPGYCWHCDMDVPCPTHPSTSCGHCEYACHCVLHRYASGDCDEFCREDPEVPVIEAECAEAIAERRREDEVARLERQAGWNPSAL